MGSQFALVLNHLVADGLPYMNSDVAYAGRVEAASVTDILGWALEKTALQPTELSIRLGGQEIGRGVTRIARHDVAELCGAKHASFGFRIHIHPRLALEAISAAMVSDRSGPLQITVAIADRSSSDAIELDWLTDFDRVRSPDAWLEAFGYRLSEETFESRRPRYERLALIAGAAKADWLAELLLSSFLPHAVGNLDTAQVARDALDSLFDAGFVADRIKARLQLADQPNHPTTLAASPPQTQDLDPHPLFCSRWYRQQYGLPQDVIPWIDYVTGGWACGREPNPFFFARSITGLEAAAIAAGQAPLVTYLTSTDWNKCRTSPLLARPVDKQALAALINKGPLTGKVTPLFDLEAYSRHAPKSIEGSALVEHYLSVGEDDGVAPSYIFDPHWYRKTYAHHSALIGPLLHYLWSGELQLRDPSPYFSTRHYVAANNDVALAGVSPATHYILRSSHEPSRRASPLVDERWLSIQPGGAQSLRALLDGAGPIALSPHPALLVAGRTRTSDLIAALFRKDLKDRPLPFGVDSVFTRFPDLPDGIGPASLTCGQLAQSIVGFEDEIATTRSDTLQRLKMDEPIVRLHEVFNDVGADALVRDVLDRNETDQAGLVSVILPARNRETVIAKAIASVLRQTYRALELIIIDDGSTDATVAVATAEAAADPRVRIVQIPPSGVSAARNAGLSTAQGDIIAYLDSDNTWTPTHLQVMLSEMRRTKSTVAHSALRIFNPSSGHVRYRGAVYDRDAMDRENYIDMNVLVHGRHAVDGGHRFDESLKRCVDWDFIRRLCLKEGPSHYVPVIGCNYLDDDGTLDRITSSELVGDFYRLSSRHMPLDPHVTGHARGRTPSYTVIWPLTSTNEGKVRDALWAAARHLRFGSHELIVINNNASPAMTGFLSALSKRVNGLRVIHLWRSFMAFPAVNLAQRLARGDRLLFWGDHAVYDGARIDAFMSATLGAGEGLHFPAPVGRFDLLLGGLIRVATDGTALEPVMSGQRRDRRVGIIDNVASLHFPVAISATAFLDASGFDTDYALHLGLADLAVRMMHRQNRVCLHLNHPFEWDGVPDRFGNDKAVTKEEITFRKQVVLPQDRRVTTQGDEVAILHRPSLQVVDGGSLRPAPAALPFVAKLSARGLRIAIQCPAPDDASKSAWGDYHFAMSLAQSFRQLGHEPSIRLRNLWSAPPPAADVAIHLRGTIETRPVLGALNLLWIISHPEKVTPPEIAMADLVLVPSELTHQTLSRRFGIRAEIMPQATDANRFAFRETAPLAALSSRFLFVGNSRRQPRRIVLDAVSAGLPLDVYGADWEFYFDPAIVKATYVPNDGLAEYYRSALCVLNDHWPSMASHGIVSNRLFDVVAAGGVAISDDVPGIESLFGNQVRTCRSFAELQTLSQSILDWAPPTAMRRQQSAEILLQHSFDARAAAFINLVQTKHRAE